MSGNPRKITQPSRGKLIVIEGIDGTGKQTQSELLVEHINNLGFLKKGTRAHLISFPNYQSKFGKLITEYLEGGLGDIESIGANYPALLYALDRHSVAKKMETFLTYGHWIVCDRYYQSNLAHQGAKITDPEKREAFYQWLLRIELEHFGIPVPDCVILLKLSDEIVQQHLSRRQHQDEHERNKLYLGRVAQEYSRLAEKHNWNIIRCDDGNQQFLPEQILENIWSVLETSFSQD